MSSVQGSGGNIPEQNIAQYKAQFAQGLNLFEKSLDEYQKASEVHKKAKFKDVMDKALQVMNETAGATLEKQGKQIEEKLNTDYNSFIAKESQEGYLAINRDISALKEQIS